MGVVPTDAQLTQAVDGMLAEHRFSGAVRVDLPDREPFERAVGFADRRWSIPFTAETRAGLASGAKGFTALAVMSLVESGHLSLDTTARSILGGDLALIDDLVTVRDLLAHRSGIGDYLDESAMAGIDDYAMPVPVHRLDSTESYLAVLDAHPQVSPPGERFAYNNGGYVVLALLAERVGGAPFEQLVSDRVCAPAGLTSSEFVRSDALPPDVAVGYLDDDGLRTNALHLPVLGSGDGGVYSTVADIARLWVALFDGDIVSVDTARLMTSPSSKEVHQGLRYGLGFWLAEHGPAVSLEGYDAGVSFRSWHDPTIRCTHTVISNTSEGAWPMSRALREVLGPS